MSDENRDNFEELKYELIKGFIFLNQITHPVREAFKTF